MEREAHPAAENVYHLQQAIEMIRRLEDRHYLSLPDSPFGSGVGSQFRHSLDFYRCFFRGLDGLRIDYSHRERDPRVESDRAYAIECVEHLIRQLEGLDPDRLADIVSVRGEDVPAGVDERTAWAGSTVGRELQFLTSHTIHHHALIVLMLRIRGFEPGTEFAEFGVAPSTLEHWKQAVR